jgi:hypothetical protein
MERILRKAADTAKEYFQVLHGALHQAFIALLSSDYIQNITME